MPYKQSEALAMALIPIPNKRINPYYNMHLCSILRQSYIYHLVTFLVFIPGDEKRQNYFLRLKA